MSDELRFDFRSGREGIRNPAVSLLAESPQECRINGLLYQRMLKPIDSIGRLATAVYQTRCNELVEPIPQGGCRQIGDCADQLVSELSPRDRANLSHPFRIGQAIQTGQQ